MILLTMCEEMRSRWQILTTFVHLLLLGFIVALAAGRISSSYRAHKHVSLSAISQDRSLKRVFFGAVRSDSLVAKFKDFEVSFPAEVGFGWDLFVETPPTSIHALAIVSVPESAPGIRKRARAPPFSSYV